MKRMVIIISRLIDLTGMSFGHWKVICRSNKRAKNTYWKCLCTKCNRVFDVSSVNLKSGNSTQCRSCAKFVDLTGKKFNNLYVDKLHKRDVNSIWECTCSCGNKVITTSILLTNNRKTSCGCMNKSLKKFNRYDLNKEFGIGYTSNNDEFYFDIEDYDIIKSVCWYIDSQGYVVGRNPHDNLKMTKMHKLITGNTITDHINRNKLDNRKKNLRSTTAELNAQNKSVMIRNKSGIIGVHKNSSNGNWFASLSVKNVCDIKKEFESFEDAVVYRLFLEKKYCADGYAPQRHLFDKYEHRILEWGDN